MSDDIVYKCVTGLDAIAAWSKDHPESIGSLRAIFMVQPPVHAPVTIDSESIPQALCIVPQNDDLLATPEESAKQFLSTRQGQVAAEVIRQSTIGTFSEALGKLRTRVETPDLLDDLEPDDSSKDAGIYMAILVCHVWIPKGGYSSQKALNYVFRTSKEGSPLYSDCRYARTLRQKYERSESTILKDAKMLHSRYNSWKKGSRRPYMPNIWRDMVQESKALEKRASRKQNTRGR